VNLGGYPKTLRPVLTAEEMVELFGGLRARGPVSEELVERLAATGAEMFEHPDPEVQVGFYVDCSAIAADLEQPIGVRRLAATLALAFESAHDDGSTSWERVLDWLIASEYLHDERSKT
jgi:hypothetical protein